MNEKRFILAYENGNEAIFEDRDNPYGSKRMTNKEVEKMLNYLEEENKKLKEQNRKLYKCALYGKTVGDDE